MTAGQFGSLADPYQHENNDHNAWLAANFRLSDDFALYGQALLTESSSSFSDLFLDDSYLPGTPPGFDYASVTELEGYSNLRLKWWHFESGLQQLIQQRYALEYVLTYSDYNDFQPFLVDTTGSRFGLMVRANWLF